MWLLFPYMFEKNANKTKESWFRHLKQKKKKKPRKQAVPLRFWFETTEQLQRKVDISGI